MTRVAFATLTMYTRHSLRIIMVLPPARSLRQFFRMNYKLGHPTYLQSQRSRRGSFGSAQDKDYWSRSYISGATSRSDPPPAYNLDPTTINNNNNNNNRRASAAPTYCSRPGSWLLMDLVDRRTQAPATSLPALRIVLPEGDDGWASEFDRELKTPYSLGRLIDPDTPAGTYVNSPSTGCRFEKR